MDKQRLTYIDIAKGILILFVLLGHLLGSQNKDLQDDFFLSIALSVKDFLWVPYYMPAFFIITGYCSNFDKPFKQFLITNLKTIKFPAIIFGILYMGGHFLNHNDFDVNSVLKMILCSPIHSGYWFLDTLFIIKMLQWSINKIINNLYTQFIFGVIIAFIGAYIINFYLIDDYFSIGHSLLMFWTISFGQILKKVNIERGKIIVIFASIGYIVCYALAKEFAFVPFVTSKISISLWLVPVNIFLSVCGSIIILYLCNNISNNKALEFCGINSLIFYCVHLIVLSPVLTIGKTMCDMILPFSIVNTLIDFTLLIIICIVTSLVFNETRLKILLGKF